MFQRFWTSWDIGNVQHAAESLERLARQDNELATTKLINKEITKIQAAIESWNTSHSETPPPSYESCVESKAFKHDLRSIQR